MNNLNTTNTNIQIEGMFTYEKVNLPSGKGLKIIYSYNDFAVPIMFYQVMVENSSHNGYSRLDFYGMFFRMSTLGEEITEDYLTWIREYLSDKTQEDGQITRYDMAWDIFSNNPQLKIPSRRKFFKKINEKTKHYTIGAGNDTESWSVGSKTAKRVIFRMYNKKLDISSKGKQRFYGDYLAWEKVHRFEVQLGPHYCKGYTLQTIDSLVFKINATCGITDKHFDGKIFYKYDCQFDINEYNKLFFTKIFIGKAKKFLNSNISPYKVIFDYLMQNSEKFVHYPMLQEMLTTIKGVEDLDNVLAVLEKSKYQ